MSGELKLTIEKKKKVKRNVKTQCKTVMITEKIINCNTKLPINLQP